MSKRIVTLVVTALLTLAAGGSAATAAPRPKITTQRVSVSATGLQANERSYDRRAPAPSDDGRFVAFSSEASNLVEGDTNGATDVFVKDRITGTVERVTVSSSGEQANAASTSPAISGNGRFVSFHSWASNLSTLPCGHLTAPLLGCGGLGSAYVHDRTTGVTSLISVDTNIRGTFRGEGFHPSVSDDGCVVAYTNDEIGGGTLRVHDCTTGVPTDVGGTLLPGERQFEVDIAGDGRTVAFRSIADGTPAKAMVYDTVLATVDRVDVNSSGEPANGWSETPSISDDGRLVAFVSLATNLGGSGDPNLHSRVYVRDRLAGTTQVVSMTPSGTEASGREPVISGDGTAVAYTNSDPRYPHPRGMYLRRLDRGDTVDLSEALRGAAPDGELRWPNPSQSGRIVTFLSNASNLVTGDTNGLYDVFVRIIS